MENQSISTSFAILSLYLALFINPILSFMNANVLVASSTFIILSEMLIVGVGTVCVLLNYKNFPLIFFIVSMILSAYLILFFLVSLNNNTLYLKAFRDMLLIGIFFLIGFIIRKDIINNVFFYTTCFVAFFAILDGWFIDEYVKIFQPNFYFYNTRGYDKLDIETIGVFGNTLSFEGRFNFGFFGQRRLSSIFLEQISFANYTMVLIIFLLYFWEELNRFKKFFYGLAILFFLMVTSSRTGIVFSVIAPLTMILNRFLPKIYLIILFPVLFVFVLVFSESAEATFIISDDFVGRLEHTSSLIKSLNFDEVFGGNISKVERTYDSGFAYIIITQTGFGLILFWLFINLLTPVLRTRKIFISYLIQLYIFLNLAIGASTFSIKVSPLLWCMTGFIYYREYTFYDKISNSRIKF